MLFVEDVFLEVFRLAFVDLADQAGQVRRAVHRVLVIVVGQDIGIGDKKPVEAFGRLLGIEAVGSCHEDALLDAREGTQLLPYPAPR